MTIHILNKYLALTLMYEEVGLQGQVKSLARCTRVIICLNIC